MGQLDKSSLPLSSLENIWSLIGEDLLESPELLTTDSRQLKAGSVFVAYRGASLDGHDYIDRAVLGGASALIIEDLTKLPSQIPLPVFYVKNSRKVLAELSQLSYREPSKKLKMVGITGTNGKTTTAYLVEYFLNCTNAFCGVIGTIDHHLGNHSWETSLTSPSPQLFAKRLDEFVSKGAKACVVETSSHALDQCRVSGCHWDVGVFTGLSRDHLDYHKSEEAYFQAKNQLFSRELAASCKKTTAVACASSEWTPRLSISERTAFLPFGCGQRISSQYLRGDFRGSEIIVCIDGMKIQCFLPLIGDHNIQNLLAAVGVVISLGLDPKYGLENLSAFRGIPGRMQRVVAENGRVGFVDFAHSPDALATVLKGLRKLLSQMNSQAEIHLVFGCGGERDAGKRALMGEVAERFSDYVWVTSDNPRSEEPLKIIQEVLSGMSNRSAIRVEVDRQEAIRQAAEQMKKNDVLLIAGKGHENTQTLKEGVLAMSDFETLKLAFGV